MSARDTQSRQGSDAPALPATPRPPLRLAWLFAIPVALCVATLVMWFGPYPALSALGTPFDEAPAESVANARQRLADFGPRGVALYRTHLLTDLLFASANAAVFLVLIAVAASRLRMRTWLKVSLASLPLLFCLADFVENALLGALISAEPTPTLVTLSASVTRAKFALFSAAFLAAIVLTITWAIASLRRRRSRSTASDVR